MLRSILDSDTYKFSMQAAVLQRMPELYGEDPPVAYRFTNRGSQRFSRATYDAIKQAIAGESLLL